MLARKQLWSQISKALNKLTAYKTNCFRTITTIIEVPHSETDNIRVQSLTGLPQLARDSYGYVVDPSKPHQSSKLTHQSDAEEMIFKVPPIEVDEDIVRCMGAGRPGFGHPTVYIQTNTRELQPVRCKYCGLRYVRKHHH